MHFELFAYLRFVEEPEQGQQEIIDSLTRDTITARIPERVKKIKDQWVKSLLLTQFLITPNKTYAQTSDRRNNPTGLRKIIKDKLLDKFFEYQCENFVKPLGLWQTSLPSVDSLPHGSFAMQFDFTLRKPYISQDDTEFYIIDNPIKKEWVFKVPYVAPSQWKGALRATMIRHLVDWWSELGNYKQNENENRRKFVPWRLQLTRLFGNEKEVSLEDKDLEAYLDKVSGNNLAVEYRKSLKSITDTGFIAGSLHFYPTYFTQIDLEVINPHDRETGTGILPIYFECVPINTKGYFTLLYVPINLISENENKAQQQVADDLSLIVKGIKSLITEYGFGAKTSNGFGVADIDMSTLNVAPEGYKELVEKAFKDEEGVL